MRYCAALCLVILTGCGGQPASDEPGLAGTTRLYFRVECLSNGPRCQEVKKYLEAEIPKFKYSFTEQSSRQWPYFQAFNLDARVPIDSLLPPHTRLHQLLPYGSMDSEEGIHEVVVVELFSQSDSIADYQVNIFQLDQPSGELLGTSGLHTVEVTGNDSLPVREIIKRSVIRYSYK